MSACGWWKKEVRKSLNEFTNWWLRGSSRVEGTPGCHDTEARPCYITQGSFPALGSFSQFHFWKAAAGDQSDVWISAGAQWQTRDTPLWEIIVKGNSTAKSRGFKTCFWWHMVASQSHHFKEHFTKFSHKCFELLLMNQTDAATISLLTLSFLQAEVRPNDD